MENHLLRVMLSGFLLLCNQKNWWSGELIYFHTTLMPSRSPFTGCWLHVEESSFGHHRKKIYQQTKNPANGSSIYCKELILTFLSAEAIQGNLEKFAVIETVGSLKDYCVLRRQHRTSKKDAHDILAIWMPLAGHHAQNVFLCPQQQMAPAQMHYDLWQQQHIASKGGAEKWSKSVT